MESLTIPVSVFGAAEASTDLLVPEVLAGICIWAAMSIGDDVRNSTVFATVCRVFMSTPFLVWLKLYCSCRNHWFELSPPGPRPLSDGQRANSWLSDPHRFLYLGLLRGFWPQCARAQGSLLHQHQENRNQNQHVNRGGNHSTHHRRGTRLHHDHDAAT